MVMLINTLPYNLCRREGVFICRREGVFICRREGVFICRREGGGRYSYVGGRGGVFICRREEGGGGGIHMWSVIGQTLLFP